MSNNKRRTLFSVRVHFEHRKIFIHQREDHSSQTKITYTFQNTNWRHPQKYQQPAEDSYLLISFFKFLLQSPTVLKGSNWKRTTEKPIPLPSSQKVPPYLNVSGPHQKDYLGNFFLDFSVAQAWTQNKWRNTSNSEKHLSRALWSKWFELKITSQVLENKLEGKNRCLMFVVKWTLSQRQKKYYYIEEL